MIFYRFFFGGGGYKHDKHGYKKCGKCGHKHGYDHKNKKCDCKYKKNKPGTCCCKFTLAENIVNYLSFIIIIAVLAALIILQVTMPGRKRRRRRALSQLGTALAAWVRSTIEGV